MKNIYAAGSLVKKKSGIREKKIITISSGCSVIGFPCINEKILIHLSNNFYSVALNTNLPYIKPKYFPTHLQNMKFSKIDTIIFHRQNLKKIRTNV